MYILPKNTHKQKTKSPAAYKQNAILRYKLVSIPLNANEMLASRHFSLFNASHSYRHFLINRLSV